MMRNFPVILAALVFVLLLASPAAAAGPSPVMASYWSGFIEHWQTVFQQQNGVAMVVVAMGAVALFIITRGKWLK